MRTRELIDYAKHNGYNSVKFCIKKYGNMLATARFLDAYYEFIIIPVLGDGFIMLSDLDKIHGYDLEFDILNEDEYKALTALSFSLRGMLIPKEFQSEVK